MVMIPVFAHEAPPATFSKSIFLAGPTPRSSDVPSWRSEALRLLAEAGYDGVVFVPEPRDGNWQGDYTDQVDWEERHLHMADCILFWVPRDLETMPAFTTNVEFGVWQESGKVVFGAPQDAAKNRYLLYYAAQLGIPSAIRLADTVTAALAMVGDGALRSGGEREVPLLVWRTASFQQWKQAQEGAGNRLDGARMVWNFRVGPQRKFVLFWALHVNVYVAAEGRNKSNEVVISRPDISTVVMYQRGDGIENAQVVLIKEFRSPSRGEDGFVYEVPGGSSFKPGGDPFALAAAECKEETGVVLDPERIRRRPVRQLAATMSAHAAHVFCVELTQEEIEALRAIEGQPRGVAEDTERTYVVVARVGDLLKDGRLDWANLGMILSVLLREEELDRWVESQMKGDPYDLFGSSAAAMTEEELRAAYRRIADH